MSLKLYDDGFALKTVSNSTFKLTNKYKWFGKQSFFASKFPQNFYKFAKNKDYSQKCKVISEALLLERDLFIKGFFKKILEQQHSFH